MSRPGSTIVHPLLMQALPDHFNSSVSIGNAKKTQDEYNEETIVFESIPHLKSLRGYKEVVTRQDTENNQVTYIIVQGRYNLQLQGYYPEISREMQALVDGRAYNITDVAHDDTKTLTWLALEAINKQSEQPYSDT